MSTPATPDSGYGGDESGNSTLSLTPSAFDLEVRHGRAYQSYNTYRFPHDDKEQNRLDFQHMILQRLLRENLFLAPISGALHNVLDIGTGTGIWAIDVADTHESCSVLGIDLSPIQPLYVPPNCRFQIWDANKPWNFQRESFDLIHCRQSHIAVREDVLLPEALQALRPGGWLEMKEMALPLVYDEGTLEEGEALSEWQDAMVEASDIIEASFNNPRHYARWMKERGFVNVREEVFRLPIGPWEKDEELRKLGLYQMANLLDGLDGFSKGLFLDVLKWSREELEFLLVRVRNDIQNRRIHAYVQFYVVYGQKPGEAEAVE